MPVRDILDRNTRDFIQSGEVSLYLASCDAQRRPRAARALGCRVAAETGEITAWVSGQAAPALVENIAASGRLALVASHVETLKTFQIKTENAETRHLESADHAPIASYHEAFIQKTLTLGYPEAMLRSMMQYRLDKLVAVVFTASAVFAQTPGPGAGGSLAPQDKS